MNLHENLPSDGATIIHGDCIENMRQMPHSSVDAIVTDPPYGLGFSGVKWDTYATDKGDRTAGDHIFDHVGGNHNATSAADAARTARAESRRFGEWCDLWTEEAFRVLKPGGYLVAFGGTRTWHRVAGSVEDAGFEIRDSIAWIYGSGFPKGQNLEKAVAKRAPELASAWAGWNTALKPAFEPIVLARKPVTTKTIVENVLENGTGGLNVDATRFGDDLRFPANVILDQSQSEELEQARFFYAAKASKVERPTANGTAHPTVKPLSLMRYLVKLVTPPSGTVLEPFAGSGATVEACLLEGFNVIAIERVSEYIPLINARIGRIEAA